MKSVILLLLLLLAVGSVHAKDDSSDRVALANLGNQILETTSSEKQEELLLHLIQLANSDSQAFNLLLSLIRSQILAPESRGAIFDGVMSFIDDKNKIYPVLAALSAEHVIEKDAVMSLSVHAFIKAFGHHDEARRDAAEHAISEELRFNEGNANDTFFQIIFHFYILNLDLGNGEFRKAYYETSRLNHDLFEKLWWMAGSSRENQIHIQKIITDFVSAAFVTDGVTPESVSYISSGITTLGRFEHTADETLMLLRWLKEDTTLSQDFRKWAGDELNKMYRKVAKECVAPLVDPEFTDN